ncbi:hypothetical protein BGZ98_005579 [Dissophora globulifera]|nr:hypothetical protein BGZ98_005579 [Dissophora globulifera]
MTKFCFYLALGILLCLGANAATLQNCQVDKGFDVLPGSHGTDAVRDGSIYYFKLVGKVLKPYPKGTVVSVGFRESIQYIWTAQAPLCNVLTSGPSSTNCHGLPNNKKGLTGRIRLPKSEVKVPKPGTALQLSIEFLDTADLALTCIKGTAQVA